MIPKPVNVSVPVLIRIPCSLSSLVPHPSTQPEETDHENRGESRAMHLSNPRAAAWVLAKLSGETTGNPWNISKLKCTG